MRLRIAGAGRAISQAWQCVVRWGSGEDGPGEATGFAIALDLLSVALGAILAAVLVWTAQFWLPLPDDLLWLAFGFCLVSLASIRTTPTGLLRLRFQYGKATAAEAIQRSEERRVGKEWVRTGRSRWEAEHRKK